MSNANLRAAVFGGAVLLGADLSYADLSTATGITGNELEQQASELACATMPDGTKHD